MDCTDSPTEGNNALRTRIIRVDIEWVIRAVLEVKIIDLRNSQRTIQRGQSECGTAQYLGLGKWWDRQNIVFRICHTGVNTR